MDRSSGEIYRHIQGTRIGPTQADQPDLAPDYPLLPTRRRFWERLLRAIDRPGTAAQLRTQLRIVHEARNELLANYKDWQRAKELKEERLPRWQKLRRLLAHADGLEVIARIRPQVEAIERDRSLLAEPDPVQPLLEELTTSLRNALQAARQSLVEAREREIQAMRETAEWGKLADERWRQIFAANGLGPIPEPNVGTDESLLRALDEKPLRTWEMEIEAIPARMNRAREEAAKLLEPKAVRVRPRSTTLRTTEDAEAYLKELQDEIMAHIKKGRPVII